MQRPKTIQIAKREVKGYKRNQHIRIINVDEESPKSPKFTDTEKPKKALYKLSQNDFKIFSERIQIKKQLNKHQDASVQAESSVGGSVT